MKRLFYFLTISTIFTAISSAATIVASSACTTREGSSFSTVTGTTYCSNNSLGGTAGASSYSNLTIAGNTLRLDSGSSILAGGTTFTGYGFATTSIQTTVQIGTEGPVRDGLVFGLLSQGFLPNGAGGGISVSADPDYFAPGFLVGYTYPRTVQLGTPLTLRAFSTASGGASYSQSAAGGGPGLFLTLSFFEADGVTPVAIADVPEPRWLLLPGFLLSGLLVIRKRALSF